MSNAKWKGTSGIAPRNAELNKKLDLHPKKNWTHSPSPRTAGLTQTDKPFPSYRPRAKVTLAKVWEKK